MCQGGVSCVRVCTCVIRLIVVRTRAPPQGVSSCPLCLCVRVSVVLWSCGPVVVLAHPALLPVVDTEE